MATIAPLASLLATMGGRSATGPFAVTLTPAWMQGRTTYGGCSAALCLEAARRMLALELSSGAPLPPLRSASVAFAGAVGGAVEVRGEVLRRGKAMSFVRGEVLDEKGQVATSATFAFGLGRPSLFHECSVAAPPVGLKGPEDCEDLFAGAPFRPVFTQNFEARLALGGKPASGYAGAAEHFIWVRHRGCIGGASESGGSLVDQHGGGESDGGGLGVGSVAGVAAEVAMLALADMPPPAMLPRFPSPAPIASATWHVNFLEDLTAAHHPAPAVGAAAEAEATAVCARPGGWWLLMARAEHAKAGYSSQDMALWGRDGRPVLVGRQSVAIFA